MDRTYVTILFEKDATEWNTYVGNCFTHILETFSLQDWSIDSQKLKDIQLPLTPARIGLVKRSRLQVIILSPKFLDFIANHHPAVVFGQLFDPQRVICLLCGVKTEDINSSHRASLISYDDWHKMLVVDNDTEFAKKLFALTQELIESDLNIAECENSGFKLNPLKVREGFSKVTIELEEPISNADKITVYLTSENNETIPLNVKQYNPYTLKICIPERFFGISQYVHIYVKNDGESLGQRRLKCESKMAELNHLLKSVIDPFSFMCQTLGLPSGRNNRDGVDKYLVDCFNINTGNWGLYRFELSKEDCLNRKFDEEYPTLLHWSARYGLQEFCSVLLDCSKAATACRIRNRNGHTAADVAEANGFSCLAKMLENFTKLSETAEMYIYMKDMTENIESVSYENLRVKCPDNNDIRSSNSSSLSNRHTISLGDDVSKAPTAKIIDKESKLNGNKENGSAAYGSADVVLRNKQCDSFEQELIQLMEDFKREKYTLSEVETLCDHLHLTHNSRTFNEKQEQLNALRQQYEQTQSMRQQEGKKSFEIFKTLFKRNGKREAQISSPIIKVTTSYVKPRTGIDESLDNGNLVKPSRWKIRPTSSLSSGSRTSSGSDRSSTLSGVSSCSASDNASLLDIEEEERMATSNGNPKIHNGRGTVVQNQQYFGVPELANVNGSPKCRSLSESRQFTAVPPHHSHVTKSKSDNCKRKDFKPEPLPRPDWLSKKTSHLSSSVDSNFFDDDVIICPTEPPPPLPSNAGGTQFPSFFNSKTDVYMKMEGSRSAPSLAVVTNEPDYYNLSLPTRSCVAEYLEMRPSHNAGTSTNKCALYENTRVYEIPDFPPPDIPVKSAPRTASPSAFARYFNLKGSPPK